MAFDCLYVFQALSVIAHASKPTEHMVQIMMQLHSTRDSRVSWQAALTVFYYI